MEHNLRNQEQNGTSNNIIEKHAKMLTNRALTISLEIRLLRCYVFSILFDEIEDFEM